MDRLKIKGIRRRNIVAAMASLCVVFLTLRICGHFFDMPAWQIPALIARDAVLIGVPYYLFMNGRMRKTRWRIPACLLVAIYIIGKLSHMQRWPGSILMINLATTGLPLLYGWWFLFKQPKSRNDIVKFAGVVYYFGIVRVNVNIVPLPDFWITDMSAVVMTFVLWHFHRERLARETLARLTWEFET